MQIAHGGTIFTIARQYGWDWRDILDASANINPLGPAPGVKPAICSAIDRIAHYPEPQSFELAHALAEVWDVDAEQILLGNGATELIAFLARVFDGSHAVTLALPVFSEFHRLFPDACTADLQEARTWPPRGLLVLSNPVNPSGRALRLKSLRDRLNASPDPVLVDESFLEFSSSPSAIELLGGYPQVMILRSLTKFYALPGVRVGALIAPVKTVQQWKKQREPWQVSVLAEAAAVAAVSDRAHAARSVVFVREERAWLQKQIGLLRGTRTHASEANFLHVKLSYAASDLCAHLLRRKILIRNCSGWPGLDGESVRVAVRTRGENERLLSAWKEFN